MWTQALFLTVFGISDPIAKLPSALCAIGVILLVYWLARRLLANDTLAASVAMFVMLGTPYFIKYAGRAMTDVPTALMFVCAICAWSLAAEDSRWYLAAGAFTAMSLMVRGLIGCGLPVIFAVDLIATRRRPAWRYLIPGLMIAILPVTVWYGYQFLRYRSYFVDLNGGWLSREVYGSLNPPWRRYTGLIEYLWMLTKSYWPWLPFTLAGVIAIGRERRRPLFLLLGWAGTVLLLCAAARSRVLRVYAAGLSGVRDSGGHRNIEMDPPAASSSVQWIGYLRWPWLPRYRLSCWFRRPGMLLKFGTSRDANGRVLPPGEKIGFHDKEDPRYDETNQLEWYGNNVPEELFNSSDLEKALQAGKIRVYVVDMATYERRFQPLPHEVIAKAGHLISVRVHAASDAFPSHN